MKRITRKNILYSLYTAVFVGACLVPAVMMPFSKADGAAENRALADKPKLKNEDGSLNENFFSDFETYFSENFAFRQQLVTLDGKLRADVLGTSSNEDVIIGKEDWLFYGDTTDDFLNINTLSERAVENIYHNMSLLSEYCIDNGSQFMVVIAPNKNSVYPEYMPERYREASNEGNYEKFLRVYNKCTAEWEASVYSSKAETLDMLDITPSWYHFAFVDLRETLREEKLETGKLLYHKTDTHWNNRGALAARNAITDYFTELEFNDFSGAEQSVSHDWSGDLAEMIYPSDVPMDEQINYGIPYTYEYVGRFRGFDDISIKTVCEGGEGSLLMYRDSFGEAIIPFMAETYASAEFTRTVPYRTDSIASGTVDYTILEIVERNLGNLQKYAPVMPAPVSGGFIAESTSCGSEAEIKCEESTSYSHVYGVLGEEFFKSDRVRIFVEYKGVTYEAFNAFEDSLLGREGEFCDRGFSLYIPKTGENESFDINQAVVTVLSDNGEAVSTK